MGPIERIGRYDVYSEIASGGMASVFLGREIGQVGVGRTVAIKRLLPHVANEPEFVRMFLDEARLATSIHNDHVVETLDIVSSGGELALVMEYVHGEALSKLLGNAARRGERIDPHVAVAIGVGIFDGLQAAHEARNEHGAPLEIVHRDVSPQNVLVGMDGVARVFDFGIAKATGRLQTTEDGSLKGKLAYMAPEQLETSIVDHRADIWAASVVLWEMLMGKRLFVADSQQALMHVVLTRDVPLLSSHGLPAQFDVILARGLARDVSARYATAKAIADDLLAVLEPASARAVSAWVKRNASAELRARARLVKEMEASGAKAPARSEGFAEHRPSAPEGPARSSRRDSAFEEDAPTAAWQTDAPPPSEGERIHEERTMRVETQRDRGSQPLASDSDGLDETFDRAPETRNERAGHENRNARAKDVHTPYDPRASDPHGVDARHFTPRDPPIERFVPHGPSLRASRSPSPYTSPAPRKPRAEPAVVGPTARTVRRTARPPSETRAFTVAMFVGGASLLFILVVGVLRRSSAADDPRPYPPPVAVPVVTSSAPTYLTMPPTTPVVAPTPLEPSPPYGTPWPTATAEGVTSANPTGGAPKADPRRGHVRPTPPHR